MHRLRLTATGGALAGLTPEDLLWRPPGLPSSVDSSLGPRLEGLGPVPALNVDFVRLAALVFFCDRTVPRPRDLRRGFELEVAVSDPTAWRAQATRISALLSLLTGDEWVVEFARRREPPLGEVATLPRHDFCLLFSGGADSACGALVALGDGLVPLAVSHHDYGAAPGAQTAVIEAIHDVLEREVAHIRWRFARLAQQAGSGALFGEESSRRSRSLLFLALGAAVAASEGGKELWVAENGFTSLNPPLVPESGGALSTRTTHPAFLRGITELLGELRIAFELRTPFAEQTKGELFSAVKQKFGAARAAEILSRSHSCGKGPQGFKGIAPRMHCGVCYGCLVRRAGFIAAGIEDRTEYAEQMIAKSQRSKFLSAGRMTTYRALEYRLEAGFDEEDVLDLGLPDDADLDKALSLIRRGLDELAGVRIT